MHSAAKQQNSLLHVISEIVDGPENASHGHGDGVTSKEEVDTKDNNRDYEKFF